MTRINPTLTLSRSLPKSADVVVLGVVPLTGDGLAVVGATPDLEKAFTKAYGRGISDVAVAMAAQSKREELTHVPPVDGARLLLVGLGDADVTPEAVRIAVGSALRVVAALPGADGLEVAVSLEVTDPELLQAAGEGALLGAYRFETITATTPPTPVTAVTLVSATVGAAQKDAVARAKVVADAVCQARDWGNTPPNLLYPETFADAARGYVRDERIAVEILDEKALEKGGYGGILAVGGGSARKPRLVRLSYTPRGAEAHLALVGKGITFDSGGLDIKPAGQMAGMKFDMSGAAAVVAATRAIAALGLKVKVTAYAALAENLPSGSSYRSSDVLTMFDGQTVENYNTDAEGRLVMADAIARAGLDTPDLIVDVATLTGACMVALGLRTGGLLTNGEATSDLLLDAAEAAGEDFWELPLTDFTREQLKSTVADMRSGAGHRWGGALVAGAFLERFVPEGVAWAHLDVAGPAENPDAPYGYVPKGGTGVAVRTLVALAELLQG
ncbi:MULTISPECIES: leucyl aminopeptidase [Tessaracoccus]|uniref:leucyl aminopeptidase n=1 Tax=Tessaracoccus TaxID=72763 RepID=UPI00099CC7DA|nr:MULTISPECIES: leucyl aminopeptidase [Tessaracoccus]VEP41375.1 putative cytosol aminopeptidase [Tessaracoccus lapidicaptus]